MSATAAERIAQRWDGRADPGAQEYLVRAAVWNRRIVAVVLAEVPAVLAIVLTGPLDTRRMIAVVALPFLATILTTYLILRRTREHKGASSVVAGREGLPITTFLDFRGVAAFDRSLAAARSRPAAH